HQDARARSRGWASLPWTATPAATPPLDARISLAAPRGLQLVRDDGSIGFEANGRAWHFAAAAEPLLRILEAGPSTIAQLRDAANGTLDEAAVQQFVSELAREGLLRVAGEPEA
ncbi:MAG TPA: hypothetical protein VN605_09950, partial [Thermoanaerobaculia bacterium]|nr:hypothetical protein [Thermoanaerobaculia bacterium]